MGIKRLNKKKMKIAAVTSMMVFSLFVAFAGVFAWFTTITSINNGANDFPIYHDDSEITAVSVYCIKYDGIYGATATRLTNEDYSFTMSEYDSIFTDKNINTPLFLRIEIDHFDKTKPLTISVPCSGDYKTGSNTYVNNYLSNVVSVKFSYGLQTTGGLIKDSYNLTESYIEGGNAEIIYKGMRDRVSTLTGTPFVTNTTTGAKDRTILQTIAANTITDTYITGDRLVVYLEFDYDVSLINNYIASIGHVTDDTNRIFQSDIGSITLRDTGN